MFPIVPGLRVGLLWLTVVVAVTCHRTSVPAAEAIDDAARAGAKLREMTELAAARKYDVALERGREALELSERVLGTNSPVLVLVLNELAAVHDNARDRATAEQLWRRAIELGDRIAPKGDNYLVKALGNLAVLYQKTGSYPQSRAYFEKAIALAKNVYGERAAETGEYISRFGWLCAREGNYPEAEKHLREALAIVEEAAAGKDTRAIAEVLLNLGGVLQDKSRFAEAEPMWLRALQIYENILPPDDPELSRAINNLGGFYDQMGRYREALPYFQRALAIREKSLDPNDPRIAIALDNVAGVYRNLEQYAEAEPLILRALAILEKHPGPNHRDTSTAVQNLAALYDNMGRYAEAEQRYLRALRIRESVLPNGHPDTAITRHGLAGLYTIMGDYAKAETLYKSAIEDTEKALGSNTKELAEYLEALARLYYYHIGKFDHAAPLLARATEIIAATVGTNSPSYAQMLGSQASFYRELGQADRAIELGEQALRIRIATAGRDSLAAAGPLNNLALVYESTGDFKTALKVLLEVKRIEERIFSVDHPKTATALNNLSQVYRHLGEPEQARALAERVLAIEEKAYGKDHPHTGVALNNLALILQEMGENEAALKLFLRSLAVEEKQMGANHPTSAARLQNIAGTYLAMGDLAHARQFAERADAAQLKQMSTVLSFTAERERLSFQESFDPVTLTASIGYAPHVARTVLRWKGVILDSLLEDRRAALASHDPEQRALLEQLRPARARLAGIVLRGNGKTEAEEARLTNEAEQLEAKLARQATRLGQTRRALGVTVEEVQAALPANAALVEFLRYTHRPSDGKKREARYGAVVLAPARPPQWIQLGPAASIETNVTRYQRCVRTGSSETELVQVLRSLHEQLWAPLRSALPASVRRVVISPDADLNFVSFATLLEAQKTFLGERYAIQYVSSGRDLLRSLPAVTNANLVVFAEPAFDSHATNNSIVNTNLLLLTSRDLTRGDAGQLQFRPLPGSGSESAALAQTAQRHRYVCQNFRGAEATESRLQSTVSPRILHLATHGFFLARGNRSGEVTNGSRLHVASADFAGIQDFAQAGPSAVNPMRRSGLALAGAQTTVNGWSRGEVAPPESDGILTAEEAAMLKLDGTWLVTLSACDTGIGESRSGEGVLGLRRAFAQAGAQNLLMTLWRVPDNDTAQFMTKFYERAMTSGDAAAALAAEQREQLVDLRKSYDLFTAVRRAGAFVLITQGK